jgi:hypothetical protein
MKNVNVMACSGKVLFLATMAIFVEGHGCQTQF